MARLFSILIFVAMTASAQSVAKPSKVLPKFLGRTVTVTDPGTDPSGTFPKGPASICVEGPPQRQCYITDTDFGRSPTAELIQVDKATPVLFFTALSGGTSGWRVHFSLLRPGTGKDLEELLLSDATVSNQSQHEFWVDPTISPARIFSTADFVWGPDEAHYDLHRYVISTYVLKKVHILDGSFYSLEDRYMTTRAYDSDSSGNLQVLKPEKPEIVARLKRLAVLRKSSH